MRILFRVDASLDLASGHVMRCLTLAEGLRARGSEVSFACRMLTGNMIRRIQQEGYRVYVLATSPPPFSENTAQAPVIPEQEDAGEMLSVINGWMPDWVVLDHYLLHKTWECIVRKRCTRLMVIDDFLTRRHNCDLLLNQNLGALRTEIASTQVPDNCMVLAGSRYALLRSGFVCEREASISRKTQINDAEGGEILVSMGGVDLKNSTGWMLEALSQSKFPAGWSVTIVMGRYAPHREQVRAQISNLSFPARLEMDVPDMAPLMAKADFAIGAAGTTSWERCALGLPAIIVELADNQIDLARALVRAGAVRKVAPGDTEALVNEVMHFIHDLALRRRMATAAAKIVDGQGVGRVVDEMIRLNEFPQGKA